MQHPTPIPSEVPAWLAAFNKVHTTEFQPYRSPRVLADSQSMHPMSKTKMAGALREVADIIEAHADDIMVMSDVWAFLHEATWCLPHVPGWCVMKHYYNHDPKTGLWKPAVWIACTTEAQANEFAPAIEEFYKNRSKHLKRHDTFKVEYGKTKVRNFIAPDCTPDEYLKRLQ